MVWQSDDNLGGTSVDDGCPAFDGDHCWSPDIYIDRNVDVIDVLMYKGKLNYCASDPEFDPRYDLNVLLYKPVLGTSRTNP